MFSARLHRRESHTPAISAVFRRVRNLRRMGSLGFGSGAQMQLLADAPQERLTLQENYSEQMR